MIDAVKSSNAGPLLPVSWPRWLGPLLILLCCMAWSCNQEQSGGLDLVAQAQEAYAAGHFYKSEQLYETYLQTAPEGTDRWEAWNRLLDIAMMRSNWERATGFLEAMHLEFGDSQQRAVVILTNLVEVNKITRDWDKALDNLAKLETLVSNQPEHRATVLLGRARVFLRKGEYDLSRDAADNCLQHAVTPKTRGDCLYVAAQAHSYMLNWEQAIALLEEMASIKSLPPERRALGVLLLADIHEQEGDDATAKALLESIIDTYPNPKVIQSRLQHLEQASGEEEP